MFKGKLITEKNLNKKRRYAFLISVIFSSLIGLLSADILSPNSILSFGNRVLILAIIIPLLIISKKMQGKALNKIYLDEASAKVLSDKNKVLSKIDLKNIETIELPEKLYFPDDNLKNWYTVLKKPVAINTISFIDSETKLNYEFTIDSSYMLIQLNKLLDKWQANNLEVKRI